MSINIFNHFWIIGGSTSDIYSSATNTMIPVDDQIYVDWAATNTASQIANEAELSEVLQKQGATLPPWIFNAPSFIQPTPTTYTKGQLLAYSADARYRHASGGVTVTSLSSVPFLTDPTSRNTVNSAYQYAVANPAHISDWKMSDGSFIKLDLAQLTILNDNMTVFVQSCFSCESTNATNIQAGTTTTLAEIDAAFAAISNVFP